DRISLGSRRVDAGPEQSATDRATAEDRDPASTCRALCTEPNPFFALCAGVTPCPRRFRDIARGQRRVVTRGGHGVDSIVTVTVSLHRDNTTRALRDGDCVTAFAI